MKVTVCPKTGIYTIKLAGKDIKRLGKAAKMSKAPREKIVAGCIGFGLAFLMYLFED